MSTQKIYSNSVASIFILVITSLLIFTGCQQQRTKNVVINFMNPEGSVNQIRLMKQIVSRFEKENPSIKVNLITGVKTEKILNSLASGSGIDLFYGYNPIQEYSSRNSIISLNELMKKYNYPVADYFPISMDLVTDPQGEVFGLPVQLKTHCFAYNKDLLSKSGMSHPPKSWTTDQFENYMRKLYSTGRESKTFSVNYLSFVPGQFVENLWDEKNNQIRKEKKALFHSDYAMFMQRLNKYIPSREEIQEASSGVSGITALFKTQKTFMQNAPAWALIDLLDIVDFEWDIVESPYNQTRQQIADDAYIAIASCSKYPEESYKFAMFYNGEYSANKFAANKNGMSARIKSTENFFAVAPPVGISIYVDILKKYKIIPGTPKLKGWGEFSSVLNSEIYPPFQKGEVHADIFTEQYFNLCDEQLSVRK